MSYEPFMTKVDVPSYRAYWDRLDTLELLVEYSTDLGPFVEIAQS